MTKKAKKKIKEFKELVGEKYSSGKKMFFVFKDNCLEVMLDKKFYSQQSERISKALKDLITGINEKTESYFNYVLRLARKRIENKKKLLLEKASL